MPKLWEILEPGGLLFLNETPHIFSPIEFHTTGLPLINYLPNRMAFAIARRYSKRLAHAKNESWNDFLRRGIRGAYEHEIIEIIGKDCGKPLLLLPTRLGCKDRVDIWYMPVSAGSHISGHKIVHGIYNSGLLRYALKGFLKTTGMTVIGYITLAIQKEDTSARWLVQMQS